MLMMVLCYGKIINYAFKVFHIILHCIFILTCDKRLLPQ